MARSRMTHAAHNGMVSPLASSTRPVALSAHFIVVHAAVSSATVRSSSVTHPTFSAQRPADEGASLPPPSNTRWWIMISVMALLIGTLAFAATRGDTGDAGDEVGTTPVVTTTTVLAATTTTNPDESDPAATSTSTSTDDDDADNPAGSTSTDRPSTGAEPAGDTTTTTLVTTTTLTESAQRDRDIELLVSFVEGLRGQPFDDEPNIVFLDNREFQDRYAEITEESQSQATQRLETMETVLASLRFFSPGLDIADQLANQEAQGVLGMYDPESSELIVRGTALTPAVKSVVVHELQHAWRDQHSDLAQSQRFSIEDESVLAWSALVEGDAVLSEVVWANGLSDEDFDALLQSQLSIEGSNDSTGIPDIMVTLAQFPYAQGYDFAEWIAVDQGLESLDGVFENPPMSTEHILHPQRYLDGDDPVEVDPPEVVGTTISQGVLGEFILEQMLAQVLPTRTAEQAADGWGGDWYVTYSRADRICTRIGLVVDSGRDVEQLNDALQTWVDANPGTRFTLDEGEFQIDSCAQ